MSSYWLSNENASPYWLAKEDVSSYWLPNESLPKLAGSYKALPYWLDDENVSPCWLGKEKVSTYTSTFWPGLYLAQFLRTATGNV